MTGQERNEQSLTALFSANIKDMEYYVDVSDDYGKLKQEYFYTKEDAIDFANKKNNIQGLSAKVYDKFGKQIKSSRRLIKSGYDEEILISVGEFGQDGDITVRKEDGKWYGSDGKTFMGYLTPEEIVEWYDKDYGSAWLCNSRKPIKSSTGTIHCVYLSDITPVEWTKDMALTAIKNSVTNYGYYEYNGKKGLCIVGDFEDIHNFIESVGHVVDEDNLYHWKEFPWDNAKKLDTVRSSRRPTKSLQALFNSKEPGWCFIFGTDKASVFEKNGRYTVEYSYGNQVSDPEYFDDEETAKEYAIDLSQSRRPIKSGFEEDDELEPEYNAGWDAFLQGIPRENCPKDTNKKLWLMGWDDCSRENDWWDKNHPVKEEWVSNSRRPIKSGYAPYYNDSTISEKGKRAYEWLCDFVGQELELDSHPWYGPCVYLDVNKMNITQDMLEEINNKMYEMDGYNSITADSGSWGYGNVYIVTFDQIRKE